MLQVRLRGLALDQSNSPVVILEVEKTNKGFGIWIGPFEAEALALAVSGKDFPRPLTYLHLKDPSGKTMIIDARPSDCLVLAVKKSFAIFVDDRVFAESSIDLDTLQPDMIGNNQEEDREGFKKFVENLDIEELKRHFKGRDEK